MKKNYSLNLLKTLKRIDAIEKNCGCSRQKAWRMIKELEAKKLIWGYTTVYDEDKIGKKHFLLMIQRTHEKIDEKTVNMIISTETEKMAKEFYITIETSAYLHGEYDWILTFIADDIKQAKRFSDRLNTMYLTGTKNISILQTLMFVRKNYILNPDRKKLKDFM